MLKFILLGVAAIVVLFLVIVALRPSDFRITRSATFIAPPAALFEQFNDLHHWNAWSPWARLDPGARYSFSGPDAGPGSTLAWAGNNQVGEGRMTIVESIAAERVRMKLEFLKPFTATNTAEFTFIPEGDSTRVIWTMSGKNNFIGKAMSLVMNCEEMCGRQFEQGFVNLRERVEPNAALTAVH